MGGRKRGRADGSAGREAIRWGIVGPGGIANVVAADLQRLPDARLVAVSSRSPDRARTFARRWDVDRAHAGLDALISDAPDVVYVAVPHAQHHTVAARLLDAGVPVLCEKAFTTDLADARDLVARADRAGVWCMEAMWTRFNPTMVRLRELIAEGAIGEVRSVTAEFGMAFAWDPAHRLWDGALGGGALLDLGVYPVSFAHMVLGAPRRVEAHGSLARTGVDREAGLLLGYEDGAQATLGCSLVANLSQTATVAGTTGRLTVDAPFHATGGMTLTHRDGTTERVEHPLEGHGYVPMLREVHRCLRAGELQSPTMPLAETLAVMETLAHALRDLGVQYPDAAPVEAGRAPR